MQMSPEQLLLKAVSINSVLPNEAKLARFVYSYLKASGFTADLGEIEKGRFNILAEKGEGESALLFYGHLDTVSAYG
ncbi:MAG: hypothetical protein KGH61_01965 [Candidatus Micrarchaeota archaeon]|nr:hypothetical protein [Candidatus Micrarchaeota archaeon]MDE1847696.1 hypothetical protein [Candidatus Micrarchaeota archaeon]MDE1864125.1 hypothetical protein [Candidatus Micrarchaeota archaeon]